MEFHTERAADLMRAYREYISSCSRIRMPDLYQAIANAPAKRFWVSAERATVVVKKLLNGENLGYMRPGKRQMFLEIYNRVGKLKEKLPAATIEVLCARVIEQPAPSFYITPSTAKIIINGLKKKK